MYTTLAKIGNGSFGQVYKVSDSEDHIFAMKLFNMPEDAQNNGQGIAITTLRECSLLRMMDHHPNIMFPLRVIVNCRAAQYSYNISTIMDHAETDLARHLTQALVPLPIDDIRNILAQILQAAAHLERHGVIHRDVKPQNILLMTTNAPIAVKLTDFGLACRVSRNAMTAPATFVQTLAYRSPEIILGKADYDCSADMWSIGCIFGEMAQHTTTTISGNKKHKPLMYGNCEIGQLYKIFQLLGTPDERTWPGVSRLPHYVESAPLWHFDPARFRSQFHASIGDTGIDLLLKMLTCDPAKRISNQDALKHAFFCSSVI